MAKKAQGFGQSPNSDKSLKKLEQKLKRSGLHDKIEMLMVNPKGADKMSKVLEKFAAPYLEFARNHSEREKVFMIAIVAWNLALMAEDQRQSTLDQFLAGQSPLAQQDTKEIIQEMIVRKQTDFADNQRLILDFQLQDSHHNYHLSVASTLEGR
ncbi:MAG: hypothetical protein KME35_19195 [Aphanocapsa sp. GSE-SYN-MK-11-07L]|jgi:hypothetical protein|nr:hypothetical protein [Aphanocapsa sp. GSE-SYN-MK-11-07L]